MNTLHYQIEVRNNIGNYFKDEQGRSVTSMFKYQTPELDDKSVEFTCINLFNAYKAITASDNINIDVRCKSEITDSYPCLYSFYGRVKKFIKQ